MCSSPMVFSRMHALITVFEQVLIINNLNLEVMPEEIPEPGQLPDTETDTQGRVAAELAIIATSWTLLHELGHLKHQQNGTGTDTYVVTQKDFHEEELSCDEFAIKFILENFESYSSRSSEDLSKVKQKRQPFIYFSLFIITLLAKDKWRVIKSHPSIQDRIDSVLLAIGTDKSDDALFIAKKSFEAFKQIWPAAPTK